MSQVATIATASKTTPAIRVRLMRGVPCGRKTGRTARRMPCYHCRPFCCTNKTNLAPRPTREDAAHAPHRGTPRARRGKGIVMLLGKTVGPFTIDKELGAGAMGAVYRAKHNESGKWVAIKVVAPNLASNES